MSSALLWLEYNIILLFVLLTAGASCPEQFCSVCLVNMYHEDELPLEGRMGEAVGEIQGESKHQQLRRRVGSLLFVWGFLNLFLFGVH